MKKVQKPLSTVFKSGRFGSFLWIGKYAEVPRQQWGGVFTLSSAKKKTIPIELAPHSS